jgi:hypothetical protein
MKGGEPNKPQQQPDIANLDQSELASNQAETVVPWFVGERKVAVTWVSPVHNLHAKESSAGGKK